MSLGAIICQFIYSAFLLLRAALEVLIYAAEAVLNGIDTFFNAVVNAVTSTIDILMSGYVTILENAITTIVDLILSKLPNKLFCFNLFKCVFLLEQLCDSASVTFRAFQKWGLISEDKKFGVSEGTQAKIDFFRSIISDFESFRETVCNFGLTFAVSLDALKAIIAEIMQKVNAFCKFLTRKKDALLKLLQKYIDYLKASGILDLLKKLCAFFKCVIDLFSSTCTAIETSKSFYNTALKKMNIEETADGFRFNQETRDRYGKFLNGRIKSIRQIGQKAQNVFDMLGEGLGLKGASNGYNLADLLKGGGNFLENGWRATKIGSYFIAKSRDFKRIFYNSGVHPADDETTYDYILNGMSIDEATGEVTVIYGDQKLVINKNNYAQYGFKLETVPDDEQFEPTDESYNLNSFVIDPETDELMSARRAGFKAHKDPSSTIAAYLRQTHDKLSSGIPEYNLADAWEKC